MKPREADISPLRQGSTRLEWAHQPKSVLLVEKIRDGGARKYLIETVQYLFRTQRFTIFVESYLLTELPHFSFLHNFENDQSCKVDFVLAFGGDGTLLHISELFPFACPPVVPFAMGSLGFLTPFLAEDYEDATDGLVRGSLFVTSRTRLRCEIRRRDGKVEEMQSLNDCVLKAVSSGSSVCAIECFLDGEMFTTIYGDGLIIATATGSTAYGLSAGGAMVHPSASALIWCPICAHSLNSHPLVLPDSVELSMRISETARGDEPYRLTCDSNGHQVSKGDLIVVRISSYPIPTVCRFEPMADWLNSISSVLRWNQPMQVTLAKDESETWPSADGPGRQRLNI
jgi:NAD+ kinase